MKFKIDHDYHIHSYLSSCSEDPTQTTQALLEYAKKNDLSEICVTDHFWDETVPGASEWYKPQNFAHVSEALPLPQCESVKFLFGCETEIDKYMTLGISEKAMEKFDFIIIPTTHLHMTGFTIDSEKTSVEERADIYADRLDKLLDMDLPFHKIGIAHPTCILMSYNFLTDFEEHLRILECVGDKTLFELYSKLAKKGAGFELNIDPAKYSPEQRKRILNPYKIAKQAGCKFYLGSDAHKARELINARRRFEMILDLLELTEADRFRF